MPVTITIKAASDGMPLISSAIRSATGVVTDLLDKLSKESSEAPNK